MARAMAGGRGDAQALPCQPLPCPPPPILQRCPTGRPRRCPRPRRRVLRTASCHLSRVFVLLAARVGARTRPGVLAQFREDRQIAAITARIDATRLYHVLHGAARLVIVRARGEVGTPPERRGTRGRGRADPPAAIATDRTRARLACRRGAHRNRSGADPHGSSCAGPGRSSR